MAHDLFISYSSKDKSVADATCAVLEAKGVRCWLAPRDIMPGAEWSASIIEAIAGARVMILIYTSSSNASPQVRREVERAVARGLHVIPFRVEDVPMSPALEYFISTPHWLDALTPPLERHLDQLSKIVVAVLEAQRAHAAEVAASTAAAASGKTAATGADTVETGWAHGPPPSAFSTKSRDAGSAAPAYAATTPTKKPLNKPVLIGASAVLALILIAIVIFFATRGDKNATVTSGAGNLPQQPQSASHQQAQNVTSDISKNSAVSEQQQTVPVIPVPPVTLPVTPITPITPVVDAKPTAADVKTFWEALGRGASQYNRITDLLTRFPSLAEQKNPAGNTPLFELAKAGEKQLVYLLSNGPERKALSSGNNTALHGAALGGLEDDGLIGELAKDVVDATNADGQTALHVAVKSGHLETAREIAEAGAKMDLADKDGHTPIQLAMMLNDVPGARAMVLMLVNEKAKPDQPDRTGRTPLHFAAANGDAALIDALLARGAKVDRAGPNARAPIHLAVAFGKLDAVRALLAKKPALDTPDATGDTPLHIAARLSDTAVAEELIAAGAKVTTSTKQRQTPFHAAAAAGNVAMVELFLRSGGGAVLSGPPPTPIDVAGRAGRKEVVAKLRERETPMLLAAAIGNAAKPPSARVLEILKKNPKLASATDADGRNALHQCAATGNVALAVELIKLDPSLARALTKDEQTPLHVAAANKQSAAVAKALLAAGSSTLATTRAGDTPLHVAARSGSSEVIKALVDAGADPAVTNKDGRQPADLATDANIRAQLAAAERDAEQLRSAWSTVELSGHTYDAKAPGAKEPVRIRFRDRYTFGVEGNINGTFQRFDGRYTKGSLTLKIDSPETLFPGLPGTTYAGKVSVTDDNHFTWKVGNAEIQFERP